jgi:hypothetical protein
MIIAKKRSSVLAVAALSLGLAFSVPTVSFAQPAAKTHKKNWVQRHPTMTAIGAGVATHHALKVAARRDKARGKKLNWAERHPTMSAIGVGAATHHIIKKHTPK